MMITDRIQSTPAPMDYYRPSNTQWAVKQGPSPSRGNQRIVLNVNGQGVRGRDGETYQSTASLSRKTPSSGEPPLVIRSTTRLPGSETKLSDHMDSRTISSLGNHRESGNTSTLTRRIHAGGGRMDSSATDNKKFVQMGYRPGANHSVLQIAPSTNRHDEIKYESRDVRPAESRRVRQNYSSLNDPGFQSDDNIWTSRLRAYPNSTIDKYGRRPVNHGTKIELDTLGVDYKIPRSPRARFDSADGLLEDSSKRVVSDNRGDLTDDDTITPLNRRVNQQDYQLSARMKRNKNYGSLPDCRPHGGSILKKSSGIHSDGGGGTYIRHPSHHQHRDGTLKVSQPSRRVEFKNNVDVYRFDSEDSANSSSECEKLITEPSDRPQGLTRARPATLGTARGKQTGLKTRWRSLDDLNVNDSTGRWWLPGKKKEVKVVGKNRTVLNGRQIEGLALEVKPNRISSVSDVSEQRMNDMDGIRPLVASAYYTPRQANKSNVWERVATPAPGSMRYKNEPNSISDPQPEEPRLRKVAATTSVSTSTGIDEQRSPNPLNSPQFIHSTDNTDSGYNSSSQNSYSSVELRTATPSPGDASLQRLSTSNRASLEGPMLGRMHNLTAASSVTSNTLTRKTPLKSNNQKIDLSQLSKRLSGSSYGSNFSSSGYHSDTLYSTRSGRNILIKKDSPPLMIHHDKNQPRKKSPEKRSQSDTGKTTSHIAPPTGVTYSLVTEPESNKKRLITTVALADLRLTPTDIRVKSNKSGNVMHVIAAGVGDNGIVDQKLLLPVPVDPYKITAKLDNAHKLVIEAPVVQ